MTDTRSQLLDTAEAEMRLRGYHAVSFRDLADALGIKSASVHYHFRQKEDLGLALVERYSQRFFEALKQTVAAPDGWSERVLAMQSTYRAALGGADRICLCGMLGAESGGLPDRLAKAVSGFFQANVDWLVAANEDGNSADQRRSGATAMVSMLQGAMMMAVATGDTGTFDRTLDGLPMLVLVA